jgi:hypothetical protein
LMQCSSVATRSRTTADRASRRTWISCSPAGPYGGRLHGPAAAQGRLSSLRRRSGHDSSRSSRGDRPDRRRPDSDHRARRPHREQARRRARAGSDRRRVPREGPQSR